MMHQAQLLEFSDNQPLSDFLFKNDIYDYDARPVGEDMAPRRYYRLNVKGRSDTLILCISPADHDAAAHPGHLIVNTMKLSQLLAANGVRVPTIYDADADQGFVLLEDFGELRFDQAIAQGEVAALDAYVLAANTSQKLQQITDIDGLPDYYQSHVHQARGRVVQWYLPLLLRQPTSQADAAAFLQQWDDVEADLPAQRQVFSHVDFHLMNLMYLADEKGTGQCGVLDFQGAMRASYVYDLVNLLGDARRLVAPEIKADILARFMADMSAAEKAVFQDHYNVLSAQFHGRCLGQFVQLAFMGKPQYLQYIPIVLRQFKDDMDAPILAPIKAWLDAHGMDFSHPITVDVENDRPYVETLLA